ncbi:MAG: hypothetical protein LUF78_03410 [Clostridiales bacterium]|nr:hypothetical protein [Clostridiales bacterium]
MKKKIYRTGMLMALCLAFGPCESMDVYADKMAVTAEWREESWQDDSTGLEWGHGIIAGYNEEGEVCWEVVSEDGAIAGDAASYVNLGQNGDFFYYFDSNSEGFYLTCLNIADGSVKWKTETALTNVSDFVYGDNGELYIGGMQIQFLALDAEGKVLAQQKLSDSSAFHPRGMEYENGLVMFLLESWYSDSLTYVEMDTSNFTCEMRELLGGEYSDPVKILHIRQVYNSINGNESSFSETVDENGIKSYTDGNGILRERVIPPGAMDASVYAGADVYTAYYYYDEKGYYCFAYIENGDEQYRFYIDMQDGNYVYIRYIDSSHTVYDYEDGISIWETIAPTSYYCQLGAVIQ